MDGTLDVNDLDGSRRFMNPPAWSVRPAARRSTGRCCSIPRHGTREMLSYDLPVLWPKVFDTVAKRFFSSARDARDRFLDRTATRYRILTPRAVTGRRPLTPIPTRLNRFCSTSGRTCRLGPRWCPRSASCPASTRRSTRCSGRLGRPDDRDCRTSIRGGGQRRRRGRADARIAEDGANRVRA